MGIHYTFPRIDGLADVMPAIAGRDDFVVAVKDGYTVVNYLMMTTGTFPDVGMGASEVGEDTAIMRRECRGLIFDTDTNALVSRPFHKFFNYAERLDLLKHIDIGVRHKYVTKLDGSMIRPFRIKAWSGFRLGSKMGITDTALRAELWMYAPVPKRERYVAFCNMLLDQGLTPLFEWTAPEDRIVVDYGKEPCLSLLAIRNNRWGTYVPRSLLILQALQYEIPLAEDLPSTTMRAGGTFDDLQGIIRGHDGSKHEGIVITFEDGHMVKMKSDEYVTLHRAKAEISKEHRLVNVILDGKLDDLLPVLPEKDRAKSEAYASLMWNGIEHTALQAESLRGTWHPRGRKEFALSDIPREMKSIVFLGFDNVESYLEIVVKTIKKNLTSRQSFDRVRWIFPDANWKDIET